jgi:hypothetical protein
MAPRDSTSGKEAGEQVTMGAISDLECCCE